MVRLVEGEPENIKITTEADLAFARGLVGHENQEPTGMPLRVGIGYDLHRLVEGRPLILGGVRIPCDRGLAGHSDADAVCHAATDAILGAAAAGSIGQHFPDTDLGGQEPRALSCFERRLTSRAGTDSSSRISMSP